MGQGMKSLVGVEGAKPLAGLGAAPQRTHPCTVAQTSHKRANTPKAYEASDERDTYKTFINKALRYQPEG